MFSVGKEYPAGSSSHNELSGYDVGIDSKKGGKPSLAERNRERQQRFRQRQKSRIEELESRCHRLTSQSRHLTAEKEELTKAVTLLKNLVQVRDLQLVAAASQLTQLLPNAAVKSENPLLENGSSVESILHHQQPVLAALEAIQKNMHAESATLQLRSKAEHGVQDGPSSTDTAAHEPLAVRACSPASTGQRANSPQLTLDHLCRVAEIAEMQQAESGSPAICRLEVATESPSIPMTLPTSGCYLDDLTPGFDKKTDVLIPLEGGNAAVHSAFLAAHSSYFAAIFEDLRHSQSLHAKSPREPIFVEAGRPGKSFKDMEQFLRYCYGSLDLEAVADADAMRLVMLADELGASGLLRKCDSLIAARAAGKRFSFFADLSQGGDVVDWLRLADRLGLAEVSGVCEMHLARYLKGHRTWRENSRLQELGQDCLLRVINKLAEL